LLVKIKNAPRRKSSSEISQAEKPQQLSAELSWLLHSKRQQLRCCIGVEVELP
jgi:hypothetical protein